mgnify:CR=1 FL=1
MDSELRQRMDQLDERLDKIIKLLNVPEDRQSVEVINKSMPIDNLDKYLNNIVKSIFYDSRHNNKR